MSADVHIDTIRTLTMTERPMGDRAEVVELTRVARLTAILDDQSNALVDYRVLQQALNEVGDVNGSFLVGAAPIGHPNLICVERHAQLVPNERDKVDITCRYEWRGMTLDSLGTIDDDGQWISRGSGSLRQITTQKDKEGNNLNVAYTYPANYQVDTSLQGKTVTHVADMQVNVPSDSLSFEGRMRTNAPGVIARTWRNKTNSAVWQGDPIGTWLCTDVSFNEHDFSSDIKTYTMIFSFLFDELEWNPDVFYRDMRQGRMPENLVQGVGIYEVPWYDQHDFNTLFP